MRRELLLLMTFLANLPLPSLVWSQQIQPDFQDLALSPGQRMSLEYTVSNGQDIPLICIISLADMKPTLEGFPREEPGDPRGCAAWATMTSDSLMLAPRSQQVVTVDLTVPRDVAGGHYALVKGVFRAADQTLSDLNLADRAVGRREFFPPTVYNALLLAEVRTRQNNSSVETDSLFIASGRQGRDVLGSAQAVGAGGWTIDLVLRNDGNTHTRVGGGTSIWRSNGTLVEQSSFAVGRGYLLPGSRRLFRARGQEPLSDGMYLARIDMAIERQGRHQQLTSFYVTDGQAIPGKPDSTTTALLKALMPKFSFRRQFMDLRIRPGRETSLVASLSNTQADTLRLRPVPLMWRVDRLGFNELATSTELGLTGPDDWVIESPDVVVLGPRRSATGRFRIKPPENLPTGEYFLGILFEDLDGISTPPSARLARSQLACLSHGTDLPFAVRLDTFAIKVEGDRLDLRCELSNIGSQRAACLPSVRISRRDQTGGWARVGDEIRFPMGETAFVLPGGERTYEQWADGLIPGPYQINLTVTFSGDERPPLRRSQYIDVSD